MARYKPVAGQTAHQLTALFRLPNDPGGKARLVFSCSCTFPTPPIFDVDERDFPVGASVAAARRIINTQPLPKGYVICDKQDVFAPSAKMRGCGCQNHNAPSNKIDRVGETFGRLTVVKSGPPQARGEHGDSRSTQICDCSCGTKGIRIVTDSLTSGKTLSCGCLRRERAAALNCTLHGMSNTPEYSAYRRAINRCTNTNSEDWDQYGGRGISMSESWLDSFLTFLADMGPRPEGCSLDRIDVNGDYCKENCRWADSHVQANNVRSNRRITAFGKDLTISEWSVATNIPSRTLIQRFNLMTDRTVEQILKLPYKPRGKRDDAKAVLKGIKARCNRPSHPSYEYYGEKGISYPPEWEHYANFIADVGERPSPDHTIDRIDTDKDYSKENCRWAEHTEQANNTTRNVWIDVDGETMNILQGIEHFNSTLNPKVIARRLRRGWSVEEAFCHPYNEPRKKQQMVES